VEPVVLLGPVVPVTLAPPSPAPPIPEPPTAEPPFPEPLLPAPPTPAPPAPEGTQPFVEKPAFSHAAALAVFPGVQQHAAVGMAMQSSSAWQELLPPLAERQAAPP